MKVFVLFLYLSTNSASTGMVTTTAEFNSHQTCEAAGAAAKKAFGGFYTNVYWACAEK